MKQMKKFLSMLLALVMVLSMLPVSAFAAEQPVITVGSVAGKPGEEVTVNVDITENPGFWMAQWTVSYDTTRLEKVEFTKAVTDGFVWTNEGNNYVFENAANEDMTYTGTILNLKFKIKEDAPLGDAEVTIIDLEACDYDVEDVFFTINAGKVTVEAQPVTGISLDQTELSLDQGGNATLTATVTPATAYDKTVTWTSSNESVATVADGVVTAVGAGSATITAKAGEFEATCAVTVAGANVPVTGITLDKSNFYLWSTDTYIMEGHSATMIANVTPDYATDKTVTWTSSDESVATIDANGVVNALKPGSVTITATAGEVSATCVITVIDLVFTATADDEPVDIRYTGSSGTKPTSQCDYKIEVPAGTKTVKLSGPMTTDWSIPSALKDTLADGTMTIDLSTYGRSGDHWEIVMVAKNGYYWGTCHVISIYMESCEGDHTFAAATCTAPKTCTVCYTTEGEALGHDLKEITAQVDAICETPGTTAVMGCTRCDYTEGGAVIPAPGHAWRKVMDTKQPTCDEDGETLYFCTTCPEGNAATKTEPIAALGHTWNEGSVTTEPTCTEKGVKSFICLVDGCGGTKTEEVPANGHSYVDGYCSVCNKKEPTLIPFTKANHTESGAAIHDKFTGIVGLEVDGVTLADWSEWVQGGNYQTQSITIYVAAEDKDKEVTFTLLLADGQTGSGALINQTATVQLNSGVGSYSATRMKIGTGGMAPQLNLNITFKHELCEEHTWVDANCTTPKTCSVCAATEGDVRPHAYENGACKYEDCKTALPFTIKSGDTALIPVQIDAANCTKAGKDTYTFDLTVPEGTTSLDFSGVNKFNLLNGETHKSLGSNKTSYSYSLSNGCITACYYDRTTQIYYHINILHVWNDATCTDPKTCANCGATEGEALGHTWGEGSICTVCGDANVITEIEVSHPSIEKNEETGAMTMAMVAGGSEKIDVSFGLVDAEVASTQTVAWFSSDTNVATVADGVVTALNAGTTTITAKAVDASGIALLADGEEVLAQFTLTVADPNPGYTVTMGDDVLNTVIGSSVSVPVTIGHTGDVTKYNAFDFTFTYDPNVLELTSTEIEGMTVTAENGTIHVERYGTDLTVGNPALTLTFKAIATGETKVEVTSAKVDISESALTQDAPDASVIDELTRVSVTGYTVNLPEDFTGASSVMPGENYTFEAKDKNYTYDVTAKIGETEIDVTDNGDGTFTIPADQITGNVVITTEKTGKVFNVTMGDDMTGAETAQYMTEYTATLTKDAGSNYNVTVEIGGKKYTSFTYSEAENEAGVMIGTVTIPGEAITGEIVFNSNKTGKTADRHSVSFTGEYGDIAEGTALEVENGTDYVLTINKVLGYKYTVTATMAGEAVEVIDNGDGTYTIKNVTGDLVITIAKEYDLTVEVAEYVTLNGKTMFLVTATGTVDADKVLSYNGTAMFYSNQYNAWSYLVITDSTLSVEDAKAQITLNEGTKVELDQTYNVNETANDTVDINDAQLVFDMYNNEYQDIDTVGMQKFLKADVNGDKKIDVNDAAAVVAEIVKNK